MRVQLRVEVAARQVAEGCRDHAVGLHPRPATRLRVVAPGLEQLRLDEAQRGAHRLVVRPHHPRARLGPRVDQRLQRDRLGCREGHVHAGPMLVLTVAKPPQAKFGAGHVACEDSLEAFWIDPPVQAEQIRRLAVPAAGLAVLRVVPGVIPVDLEVVHRPGGGLQACNGRDHGRLRLRCGVSILLERHRGQSERSSATHLGGVDADNSRPPERSCRTPVGRERQHRATSGKSTARLRRAAAGVLSQLHAYGAGQPPRVPRPKLFHGYRNSG